jgi:hypothetical protein
MIGFVTLAALLYEQQFNLDERARGIAAAVAEPFGLVGLVFGTRYITKNFMGNMKGLIQFLANIAVLTSLASIGFVVAPNVVFAVALNCVISATLAVVGPGILVALSLAIPARARATGFSVASLWIIPGLFILPIILVQALWMEMFLDIVSGGLPGTGLAKLLLPALSGVAFAAICLGISANSNSAERAHSISLTVLSANVLLSGALLGFPKALGHVVHPFITAHYGWSGIIDSMQKTPFFHPIDQFVKTWFATPNLAMSVLGVHFLLGVVLAFVGLRRRA